MLSDDVFPPIGAVRHAVSDAIAEDTLPLGDLTAGLIDPHRTGRAAFVARERGVLAGTSCAIEVCAQIDPALTCSFAVTDGAEIAPGEALGAIDGPFRSIVTAERSAVNFLCHLSGVATLTRQFVDAVVAVNDQTRIWDTRKTTPGLRALEKAAVRAGGAVNHRGSLSEGVLIKDNHRGHLKMAEAVELARKRWPGRMIEVECDQLDQVLEAVEAGATLVLLDNMAPADIEAGVAIVRGHPRGGSGAVLVEASGGINLDNVAEYACAGADVISIGMLTHSAPALDIGLDLK